MGGSLLLFALINLLFQRRLSFLPLFLHGTTTDIIITERHQPPSFFVDFTSWRKHNDVDLEPLCEEEHPRSITSWTKS
jgi:hypothetical protein